MSISFQEAFQKAEAQPALLCHDDLTALLSAASAEQIELMSLADGIRRQTVGDSVHLRGIIEFSSHCSQMCCYCGLRAGNSSMKRYRLSTEEIVAAARKAVQNGYRTLVLQSGEDPGIAVEQITEIIREIKQLDVAITLSCGERSYDTYQKWREAGADRYLIKQETADPALYSKLRPGHTLEERLQCQKWLKELGYQLGSGCMIGLPGQTLDTLAEDLLLMQRMEVDMSGMGPFIPHPATPLRDANKGSVSLTLNMLSTARIMMPWLLLPATTSLATLHPEGRMLALKAGCNVIMPNVGPQEFRKLYQIYPDKLCTHDPIGDHRQQLTAQIEALGRSVAVDYGHSMRPSFHP